MRTATCPVKSTEEGTRPIYRPRRPQRSPLYLSEAEYDRLLTGKAVTRKQAGKIRVLIEPKFGEAKRWHGLDRARWRGGWKMAIQALITFSVTNAKRLVRLIEKKEREPCPS